MEREMFMVSGNGFCLMTWVCIVSAQMMRLSMEFFVHSGLLPFHISHDYFVYISHIFALTPCPHEQSNDEFSRATAGDTEPVLFPLASLSSRDANSPSR